MEKKKIQFLDEKTLIERGVKALYKEMGPVEARRFMMHLRNRVPPSEDSVQRHRRWQASLDPDELFKEMREIYRRHSRKAARPAAAGTRQRTGRKSAEVR